MEKKPMAEKLEAVGTCDCGALVRVEIQSPVTCPCGVRWRWTDGLPQRCGPYCEDCPAPAWDATVLLNGARLCNACAVSRRARDWFPGSPFCVLCGVTYDPQGVTTNVCGPCAAALALGRLPVGLESPVIEVPPEERK